MRTVVVDWNSVDGDGLVATLTPCLVGEQVIADDLEGTWRHAVVIAEHDHGRGPFWKLRLLKESPK